MAVANIHLIQKFHLVSQLAEGAFEEAAHEQNITFRQLVMLRAIHARGTANQSAIVIDTGIDRSTCADMIGRLVRRRFVSRARSKIDARSKIVSVTDEGERVVQRNAKMLTSIEQQVFGKLSSKELDALGKILDALLANQMEA